MMDSARPNRSGSGSSELFICFTSRHSSSMKISSKSILSPGGTDKFREPTLSYSSSVTRRLKSNGSIKGGQSSPMFPTGSKKRGCGFDNTEPSSPKVTCIGQVRVKTKKQGKKMRTRSRQNGEVSFGKTECTQEGIQQNQCLPHRNQKWVHLPLTICEALRAFGAEFNCFLPCGGRSSCSSMNERDNKEEKRRTTPTTTTTSSCGAIFARWLMALQEGEDEKRREMELVVGEEERKEKTVNVFGEIEIEIEEPKEVKEANEEERVSICIPPTNALLLMRCRSEPLRTSALANRFWNSPNTKDECEDYDEEEEDEDSGDEENEEEDSYEGEEEVKLEPEKVQEVDEMRAKQVSVSTESLENQENSNEEENPLKEESKETKTEEHQQEVKIKEEEIAPDVSFLEPLYLHENRETEEKEEEQNPKSPERLVEKEESSRASFSKAFVQLEEAAALEERDEKSTEEKETEERASEEEMETQGRSATVTAQEEREEDNKKSKERESREKEAEEEERESAMLPDCLLLMMCEPKLSMEVSKETWVCSTDFIRYRPNKQVIQKNGRDESKTRISTDSNSAQPLQRKQSQVVGPSMAAMIQEKLVNAVAYEPFVLTRCKSEPLRSSTKLVPEACFWKNMKLETHRPGVGTAGVGF